MKFNYFVIPLIVAAVAVLGGRVTQAGMVWYRTIKLPEWTPSGSFIGMMWTAIFILTAVCAVMVWNSFPRDWRFQTIISLFLLNAALNVFWSYLFFGKHLLGWAVLEAGALAASVFGLIFLIWPVSVPAASLLILYALWSSFATYVTYSVWILNR